MVKRYFKVPWHGPDARAVDVLTLVCQPMLTSLLAIAASLNVMVFMQMYTRCFLGFFVLISYGSCASATLSFVAFALTIIYGRYGLGLLAMLLYQSFFVQHVVLSIEILRQHALESKLDATALLGIRLVAGIFLGVICVLSLRMLMVGSALLDALLHGGVLWDLDGYEKKQEQKYPRAFSITVPEEG
ncbi:hypothetical protein, conserved [Babesia bigemina]|uniref:Uncharacterized protein n=1 Tax=Babesia bigemina TaxID=5866 RepID=A0A061D9D0_BABBI|nr:hypothetical protein, conserved [Babesia bigemina]CDR95534.1 hypothetical protein, conserved [Babesia bigemina]|eukprot:XP_012767720.1 hypothetical protein, conserved [Babesia bigemina]